MALRGSSAPPATEPRPNGARPPGQGEPGGPGGPPPLPTITPAPKLRSRPRVAAAGIALIALGGVGGAYLLTSTTTAVSVVALSDDVQRGEILEEGDLTTAAITPDPALRTVPADQLQDLLGQRAATDLTAGSILTPNGVTTALIPTAGSTVVGVAVTAAQLPSQPLTAGDTIRIVDTPRPADEPPAGTPGAITATVVAATFNPDLLQTVVDVTVPTDQAASLAARAATGRVAIVLDSAER